MRWLLPKIQANDTAHEHYSTDALAHERYTKYWKIP